VHFYPFWMPSTKEGEYRVKARPISWIVGEYMM